MRTDDLRLFVHRDSSSPPVRREKREVNNGHHGQNGRKELEGIVE